MFFPKFKTLKELDSSEGTVQLVESTHRHLHLAGTEIVLVPQPSDNPNDPLRWPYWKKNIAFFAVCLFSFANNFTIDGPSAGFAWIAQDFNVSETKTSGLLSWIVLTLGLSNFFWIPTAAYFGKRPTFIVAIGIEFAASIWSARATSFNSLLASSVIAAFGGGASEALSAAVINDLYFLHERGRRMGYYIISIAWGSAVGPLCGGFLIENLGWQWQKWVSVILLCVNMLLFVFFFPETRFYRDTALQRETTVVKTETQSSEAETKAVPGAADIKSNESGSDHHPESNEFGQENGRPIGARKSYLSELSLWSGINTQTSYISLILRPIPLLLYPACSYALIAYSISLAPTVMIAILSSIVLGSPPYNFGAGVVGLINVPVMIGQLVGAVGGGWLTDKWAAYRAKRNNGIFEPESRLILIVPLATLCVIGILMFGFGASRGLSWPVIYVGYGFASVALTGIASISMNYAIESYYPVAQECLEVINALKNVIAFGFVYGTVPWGLAEGFDKEFGEMAGIFVFLIGLAIPLGIFGKKIRHYTSTRWRLISW